MRSTQLILAPSAPNIVACTLAKSSVRSIQGGSAKRPRASSKPKKRADSATERRTSRLWRGGEVTRWWGDYAFFTGQLGGKKRLLLHYSPPQPPSRSESSWKWRESLARHWIA